MKKTIKVKVQEYVETVYELPDDHFDNLKDENGESYTMDDMSDCEIATEFARFGKKIFQTYEYDEDPISWDTNFFNHETNQWEEL